MLVSEQGWSQAPEQGWNQAPVSVSHNSWVSDTFLVGVRHFPPDDTLLLTVTLDSHL